MSMASEQSHFLKESVVRGHHVTFLASSNQPTSHPDTIHISCVDWLWIREQLLPCMVFSFARLTAFNLKLCNAFLFDIANKQTRTIHHRARNYTSTCSSRPYAGVRSQCLTRSQQLFKNWRLLLYRTCDPCVKTRPSVKTRPGVYTTQQLFETLWYVYINPTLLVKVSSARNVMQYLLLSLFSVGTFNT